MEDWFLVVSFFSSPPVISSQSFVPLSLMSTFPVNSLNSLQFLFLSYFLHLPVRCRQLCRQIERQKRERKRKMRWMKILLAIGFVCLVRLVVLATTRGWNIGYIFWFNLIFLFFLFILTFCFCTIFIWHESCSITAASALGKLNEGRTHKRKTSLTDGGRLLQKLQGPAKGNVWLDCWTVL